jgi:hypothetical protein
MDQTKRPLFVKQRATQGSGAICHDTSLEWPRAGVEIWPRFGHSHGTSSTRAEPQSPLGRKCGNVSVLCGVATGLSVGASAEACNPGIQDLQLRYRAPCSEGPEPVVYLAPKSKEI